MLREAGNLHYINMEDTSHLYFCDRLQGGLLLQLNSHNANSGLSPEALSDSHLTNHFLQAI